MSATFERAPAFAQRRNPANATAKARARAIAAEAIAAAPARNPALDQIDEDAPVNMETHGANLFGWLLGRRGGD